MKKFTSIITIALFAISIFLPQYAISQSPQKMSYQSVIRNATDDLVTETTVGLQISILQGTPVGASVYVESHSPMTNINGLASLEIGMGTPVSGTFAAIDWGAGPYFIKTDIDPLGGTAYTLTATSELLSVPYALFAANSEIAGDWVLDGDTLSTDKLAGIGTETPIAQLHVLEDDGTNTSVIYGESTFEGNNDKYGVRGLSINAPGYGFGGFFEGGYRGVYALANSTTYAGSTYGIRGYATGTAGHRRGVFGEAFNPGGTTAYGVYGSAFAATTNYGVYGTAGSGTTNWAGYFLGNVRITSATGIENETSDAQLHVLEDDDTNLSAIYGENAFEGNSDKRGVYGKSFNAPGYGYGGYFEGGFRSVYALNNSSTYAGTTYGIYARSEGTAGNRRGVFGQAINLGGTTAYGLYGHASSATSNYGVYGFASGGTGTTNWAGYFQGNVRITGTLDNTSDARLKKDIEDLENALGIIKQLEPKTYEFRTDEFPQMTLDKRPQLGFIAQDMEKVLPQLVRTAVHPGFTNDEREESNIPNSPDVDVKSINYIGIIPVLTQGIKELSIEVEARDTAIEELRVQVTQLKNKLESVDAMTIRMKHIEKELQSLRK